MPWRIQPADSASAIHVTLVPHLPAGLGRSHIFISNIPISYICSCLRNEELACILDCFYWDTCRPPFIYQRSEEDPPDTFWGIYPVEICFRDISCGGGRDRLSLSVVLPAGKYLT